MAIVGSEVGLEETAPLTAAEANTAAGPLALLLSAALASHEVKRRNFVDLREERERRDADVSSVGRNDRGSLETGTFREVLNHRAITDRPAAEERHPQAILIGERPGQGEIASRFGILHPGQLLSKSQLAEHLYEPAAFQLLADLIKREVGEPQPIDRGIENQIDGVED